MPTGYTYESYQAAVVTQIPTVTTDPNFQTMLPNSIDYAELSIVRDLDFLSFHGNVSLTTTPGSPYVVLPSGVIVLEELYYTITTYLLDGNGNKILDGSGNPIILSQSAGLPISPLSQAALRAIYSGGTNGPPQYFSVIGNASGANWTPGMQVLLGPAPDAAYSVTAYATQREATLSADYPQTFISTQLPDLFWCAAMIWWSGYNKDFGAMTDNPQMAVSWEQEYKRLIQPALTEEYRRKFQSAAWQAQFPTPAAAQPRAAA